MKFLILIMLVNDPCRNDDQHHFHKLAWLKTAERKLKPRNCPIDRCDKRQIKPKISIGQLAYEQNSQHTQKDIIAKFRQFK